MPYRRPPDKSKRFFPPLFPTYGNQRQPTQSSNTYASTWKDYLDIPLPNEREVSGEFYGERKNKSGLSSVIDFLRDKIKIEELILIGLIILLLTESVEDPLLLIILAYILLF